MPYVLSNHVREEMLRRSIPLSVLESVLDFPQQMVPGHDKITCYQSQIEINGKMYLVRVMVNEDAVPPKVVTVYRTRKISKYWERL